MWNGRDWLECGLFPQPLSLGGEGDVRRMEKGRRKRLFQELCRKNVHGKLLMDEEISLPLTARDPREDFPRISLSVVWISSATRFTLWNRNQNPEVLNQNLPSLQTFPRDAAE